MNGNSLLDIKVVGKMNSPATLSNWVRTNKTC